MYFSDWCFPRIPYIYLHSPVPPSVAVLRSLHLFSRHSCDIHYQYNTVFRIFLKGTIPSWHVQQPLVQRGSPPMWRAVLNIRSSIHVMESMQWKLGTFQKDVYTYKSWHLSSCIYNCYFCYRVWSGRNEVYKECPLLELVTDKYQYLPLWSRGRSPFWMCSSMFHFSIRMYRDFLQRISGIM